MKQSEMIRRLQYQVSIKNTIINSQEAKIQKLN